MRKIKYIVVHCSAGNQNNSAADVISYHTRPKSKGGCGWSVAGYHVIIDKEGRITKAVDYERPSNGVAGYNSVSINVCWIGGVDTTKKGLPPTDNRTAAQKAALESILTQLKHQYPSAIIIGHRDLNAAKACPSFDAKTEYAHIR